MILNKKGVSAVVANVLIILLVVVGVALIWAAVRPSIEEGAEGIQADCFTVQIEPSDCRVAVFADVYTASGGVCSSNVCGAGRVGAACTVDDDCAIAVDDLIVTVKRNPGTGDLNGLKFRMEDAAGQTEIANRLTITDSNLAELGSKKFWFTPGTITPAEINVAALVGPQQRVCDIISTAAKCS